MKDLPDLKDFTHYTFLMASSTSLLEKGSLTKSSRVSPGPIWVFLQVMRSPLALPLSPPLVNPGPGDGTGVMRFRSECNLVVGGRLHFPTFVLLHSLNGRNDLEVGSVS